MFDFLKKWFSKEETKEALNKAKDVAGDVAEKTKDAYVDAAKKTQEVASDVVETVKEKVEEVTQETPATETTPETPVAEATTGSTLNLYAVANGEVVTIDKVSDPVFSQKFMGDGYAVLPTDGTITAPVDGEITNVFPTKHAVGFKTDNGVEVLLHMGLDTVELKGEPFNTVVNEGDRVTAGTLISTVDLEAVKAAGKDTPMIVALTNMDVIESVTINEGPATAQATIGNATVK